MLIIKIRPLQKDKIKCCFINCFIDGLFFVLKKNILNTDHLDVVDVSLAGDQNLIASKQDFKALSTFLNQVREIFSDDRQHKLAFVSLLFASRSYKVCL